MTKLLIVRHGDTEYNDNRRFMGNSDIELGPSGRQQIERLRDYLAHEKIDAVFASDLQRTITSAGIVIGARKLDIIFCPELREINYGACEGMTLDEITHIYPDVAHQCTVFTPELVFPEGETFMGFGHRVSAFTERLKSLRQSDVALVVSHMGPIKVLICQWLGIDIQHWWQIRTDTASLSIVDLTSKGAVLSRLNDTSFLHTL
jgi:alpha-ribazole phosphatase